MDARDRLEIPERETWLRIGRFAMPVFIGLVVLLGLGIYILSSVPRDPLEIACEKIVEGMSTEEAIAIIGRPRDDAHFWPDIGRRPITHEIWDGKIGRLEISSCDERVVYKRFQPYRMSPTPWQRIRRWLGW
jgi:hypothetical protein